jgi:hypothetical protein
MPGESFAIRRAALMKVNVRCSFGWQGLRQMALSAQLRGAGRMKRRIEMKARSRLATSLLALVPLVFVVGCASQSEVDSLRSEVQDTRAAAEAARVAAEKATERAIAAERRAEAAERASGDVSTKADRMFQKSLRK